MRGLQYKPFNDTPFELHVFWPSDTEGHIKLTFSESASPSLKLTLMTLLNILQEMSNVPQKLRFKKGISFEEKVYNKLSI